MRNSVKTIGVVLCFGGFGIVLSQFNSESAIQIRNPASVETKTLISSEVKTDTLLAPIAYHFERAIHAELKGKEVKPLVELSLSGTVFVTEVSHTPTTHRYGVQFELAQGSEKQSHESKLPFLVEVSNDQNVVSIQIPSMVQKNDEDDLNVLRDFVSLYAYGSNQDTAGTYLFKLKRTGTEVEKLKLKYDAGSLQVPTILTAATRGEVDPDSGAWLKASGIEKTSISGVGANQSILTTSAFKIEKLDSQTHPRVAINYNVLMKDAGVALVASAILEVRSWADLKRELANVRQLPRSKRLSLFHDLTKLLKSDPAVVLEFRKYIESVAQEPGLMTFGIGVLATAGSPSAQSVLRDWYQGKFDQEHTILNAFSTADAPMSDDTRFFLRKIADQRSENPDLAQNAVFALGSALKHSSDDEARKALQSYYSNSQSEADRISALDAIGNSGDGHFLPTLKQAIDSGTPSEKERAVFGVRFLPADTAAPLLRAAYQDENAGVRQASIRALVYQDNLSPHAQLIHDCASAGESTCKTLQTRLGQ
jgi:hypothetical protein